MAKCNQLTPLQLTPLLLQYFCQVLPINYLIRQRKLLYWNKLFTSDNCILLFLSRLVSQRFLAIGSLYGLSSIHVNQQTIKRAVWETFASTVEYIVYILRVFLCFLCVFCLFHPLCVLIVFRGCICGRIFVFGMFCVAAYMA